jgi:hypothetical protein
MLGAVLDPQVAFARGARICLRRSAAAHRGWAWSGPRGRPRGCHVRVSPLSARNQAGGWVVVARIAFVSQWLFDLARGSELRFRSSVIRDGHV